MGAADTLVPDDGCQAFVSAATAASRVACGYGGLCRLVKVQVVWKSLGRDFGRASTSLSRLLEGLRAILGAGVRDSCR